MLHFWRKKSHNSSDTLLVLATMVHPDIPIIGTTLASPINRGGVPRFLDGSLGDFGCCKAINDIRRYTSVKGIVVRQVGANAAAFNFAPPRGTISGLNRESDFYWL